MDQYYQNEPEPTPLDKPILNLKSECGSGSEKENSSNVEGSGTMTSSSGTTTTASSLNVTPIKKKKKRRISDSEDDDDFDEVPAKKEKIKTTLITATTNDEMSSVKKSKKSSSEDRHHHKKDKDRQHSSSKSCKEKHREKDRDEQMRKEKRRDEKRKSSSAPVTPLKTGSSMHRPEQPQPRKNVDELSFKLAQTLPNPTTTSTSSNSTSVGGVLSNDNSTEAIKKILNGDRVVPAAVSSPTKLSSSSSSVKASPNVTPNKSSHSTFRMSSSMTNGAHAERNKLFPRPLVSEQSPKPSTPKKLVDFSSITSNQNNSSLDLLGSIMSDMNSAMKK